MQKTISELQQLCNQAYEMTESVLSVRYSAKKIDFEDEGGAILNATFKEHIEYSIRQYTELHLANYLQRLINKTYPKLFQYGMPEELSISDVVLLAIMYQRLYEIGEKTYQILVFSDKESKIKRENISTTSNKISLKNQTNIIELNRRHIRQSKRHTILFQSILDYLDNPSMSTLSCEDVSSFFLPIFEAIHKIEKNTDQFFPQIKRLEKNFKITENFYKRINLKTLPRDSLFAQSLRTYLCVLFYSETNPLYCSREQFIEELLNSLDE